MRHDTYCGLYCGACEVFLVTRKGIVEETAKEWEMNPEDLKCDGCKTDTVSTFCKTCTIKSCAVSKGVEFCYECSEFPCQVITDLKNDKNPHHSIVFHNLKLIKSEGLEKWLYDQERRWCCPECQEKYSWYDEECSNCGSKVTNCVKDEEKFA